MVLQSKVSQANKIDEEITMKIDKETKMKMCGNANDIKSDTATLTP